MGSLTSRPKVTPVSVSSAASTSASTPVTAPTEADPAEIATTRAENILRKNRGVIGTVLTSFRGLLGGADSAQPQRKTLLGE